MPVDFNPNNYTYVKNGRVPIVDYVSNSISDMEGNGGKVKQNMSSTYLPQVAYVGYNTSTNTAASTMLDTIFSSASTNGYTIRYSKDVYTKFREGALKVLLKCDSIANGTYGQNAVPYVYFTNENNHPFMCVASYSISDKPNRLLDVHRPPGDGHAGSSGYDDQNVTRDATLQLYLYKIPMRDYGLVTDVSNNSSNTYNTLLNNLRDDYKYDKNYTDLQCGPYTPYNYAGISGIGVAIDGIVIYPIYNNILNTAPYTAEITPTGVHVGRGMGLHYHSDGHSALNNNMNLYNMSDYVNRYHPPVIGFGLDGIALYGVYETSYSSMDGYNVSLDNFGGHSHGDYGYHYHCHNLSSVQNIIQDGSNNIHTDFDVKNGVNGAPSPSNISYELYIMMKGAWKGNINSIPEFWNTSEKAPAYSLNQQHRYVGKP